MFREIPFQCHTTENLIARFDKFESFLEWRFRKTVHKPQLQVFLPVMKGLTRLLPSERITASQALEMIKADVLVGSRYVIEPSAQGCESNYSQSLEQ